jgi:hypothetical protein
MTRYILIVGDAATYEEDGEHHAEFQKIDFIKTFFIAQNLCNVVTYNPKQGASK